MAVTKIILDRQSDKTLTSAAITSPTGLVKGDVGLGNVDNTSDANKPVSSATQTALNAKKTDSMSTNKLLGRGTAGTGAIEEITLGTGLSFAGTTLNAVSSGLAASNFVVRETPTGLVNGANVTYALANTPTAGTEQVYLNGILQEPGAGNDYTISGLTITYLSAPLTGDKLRVSYMK